jgi:transcriptional regulator with XRE-family HTH domain
MFSVMEPRPPAPAPALVPALHGLRGAMTARTTMPPPNNDKKHGPDWIRSRLHELRKKRKDLAGALGLDPSVASRILSGARAIEMREVGAVAAFLEVSVGELLERLGAAPPDLVRLAGLVLGTGDIVGLEAPEAAQYRNAAVRRPSPEWRGEAFLVLSEDLERYEPGDVLFCEAVDPADALDREAVVTLTNGRRVFRRILAGRAQKRYLLVPRKGSEIMVDVPVRAAFAVVAIAVVAIPPKPESAG